MSDISLNGLKTLCEFYGVVAQEECGGWHPFLSGGLELQNLKLAVGCGHVKAFPIHTAFSGMSACAGRLTWCGGENLYLHRFVPLCLESAPGRRIGRQSADVVVYLYGRSAPVNPACLLIYFRGCHKLPLRLRKTLDRAGLYVAYRGRHHFRPESHKPVVNIARVIFRTNIYLLLRDNLARVDLVFQEESCNSRLCLAVHHGPVDGSRPTVFRQQGGMEIEGAERWHGPYRLRKHPECNYNKKVGIELAQSFNETRVLQLFGL